MPVNKFNFIFEKYSKTHFTIEVISIIRLFRYDLRGNREQTGHDFK